MKKEQSYQEAVSQLEAIISELEEPDVNMDSAKSKLKQYVAPGGGYAITIREKK